MPGTPSIPQRRSRTPSIPQRRILRTLALFIVLAVAPAQALVSASDVERQAERAFAQMRAQLPISQDIAARDYVQCIADLLIDQLDEPYRSLDWEVELFENGSANAFAMPGGKIGIMTGIFRVADTQDSLAAVIGHEIAHVIEQHALKRARRQVRNKLLVAAASGAIGGGARTETALGLGAELGLSRPYGRKQEVDADTLGLELMSKAGFDPRATIPLWKNMAKHSPGSPPVFLSTHPAPDDRIGRLISSLASSLVLYNAAHEEGHVPACQ